VYNGKTVVIVVSLVSASWVNVDRHSKDVQGVVKVDAFVECIEQC
jgi:hypothetical protein